MTVGGETSVGMDGLRLCWVWNAGQLFHVSPSFAKRKVGNDTTVFVMP